MPGGMSGKKQNLCVCLSVYLHVCTIIPAKLVGGFLETLHDNRF